MLAAKPKFMIIREAFSEILTELCVFNIKEDNVSDRSSLNSS